MCSLESTITSHGYLIGTANWMQQPSCGVICQSVVVTLRILWSTRTYRIAGYNDAIFIGDLNIHLNVEDDLNYLCLTDLLVAFGFVIHNSGWTHDRGDRVVLSWTWCQHRCIPSWSTVAICWGIWWLTVQSSSTSIYGFCTKSCSNYRNSQSSAGASPCRQRLVRGIVTVTALSSRVLVWSFSWWTHTA